MLLWLSLQPHCILLYATDLSIVECRKEVDVVFVVDSTSNLLYQHFQMYVLGTIADIIRHLDVDLGRTRVAAVQFTNTAKVSAVCSVACLQSLVK